MKTLWMGALLVVLLTAGGCSTIDGIVGSSDSSNAESTPAEQAAVAQELSPQERFNQILRLLEQGNTVAARAELMAYLQQKPDNETARNLLRQIDTPASEYFPADYRVVQLPSGGSLSTLSERYLGDLYQFHALAKYNEIDQPGKLEQGRAIKIPLTDHARREFEAPGSATASTKKVKSGSAVPTSQDVQADELHRQALNEFRAQNLDNAISLWDKVLMIDPGYEQARLYRSQAIDLKAKLTQIE